MRNKTKHTAAQAIQATKNSWGIKTLIAQRLGVERGTVYSYMKRWSRFADAVLQEAEQGLDYAESLVMKSIIGGDVGTAKWFLAMKGASRGYGVRPADLPSLPAGEPITEVAWKETSLPEESKPLLTPEELGVPGLSRSDLGLPPEGDK